MLIIPQYKQINNKIVDNVDKKLEFDMAKAREAMISERSCARDLTGFHDFMRHGKSLLIIKSGSKKFSPRYSMVGVRWAKAALI